MDATANASGLLTNSDSQEWKFVEAEVRKALFDRHGKWRETTIPQEVGERDDRGRANIVPCDFYTISMQEGVLATANGRRVAHNVLGQMGLTNRVMSSGENTPVTLSIPKTDFETNEALQEAFAKAAGERVRGPATAL